MDVPRSGQGALLMLGLPTDEVGWPYQVRTVFSEEGTTGLLEDDDGHLLVLQNTAEGRPVTPPVLRPAPAEIEAAARQWWEEQQAGS